MLCASGELGYVHEPFQPRRSPGWLPVPMPYWFMHVCEDNERTYVRDVERLMSLRYPVARSLRRSRSPHNLATQAQEIARSMGYRLRGISRPLLKDPLALFSAEWLSSRFGMRVVVMIRHPAAFVGSIKRLNWGFDYEQHWLAQELLMRDLLGHRAHEYRGYVGEVDLVHEGIVMWNSIYDVVDTYRGRHPDWQFVRYEDLATEPLGGYRSLYAALGLTWSDEVEGAVRAYSSETNPKEVSLTRRRAVRRDSRAAKDTWRSRLAPDEIDRIRAETEEIASRFYDPEDWEPA